MKRLVFSLVAAVCVVAGTACKNSSPLDPLITAASNQPSTAVTRIISVSGDLDFGTVPVGTTVSRDFTISNTGNGTLTLTAIAAAGGSGTFGYSTTFTSATIAPGGSQTVTVAFAPPQGRVFSTVVTVVGNQTSGTNTFNLTGQGSIDHIPAFSKSGTGNIVFDLPSHIVLVRITGHFVDGPGALANFVVFWDGLLALNELLRTADYDATVQMPGGGTIEIQNSSSIQWTFTEVR